MDSIKIDKRRDYIVIEQFDECKQKILKGSKLFCGCCGNILSVAKKNMKFPFKVSDLKKHTKNKTFDCSIIGLYHKTCGHTMFSFRGYDFIPLNKYIEGVKNETNNY